MAQVLKAFPLVSATAIRAVHPSSRLLALKVRVFIGYLRSAMATTRIGAVDFGKGPDSGDSSHIRLPRPSQGCVYGHPVRDISSPGIPEKR